MGLPLMAGFAAEFFIFKGAFESTVLSFAPLFTALAMFGIVIVAGYLLFAMQRTLFGPYEFADDDKYEVGPAALHDTLPLAILLVLIIALGVAPNLFFGMIQEAVNPILQTGGGL
jgi:NADH-quinone oxidoreductase subunit M